MLSIISFIKMNMCTSQETIDGTIADKLSFNGFRKRICKKLWLYIHASRYIGQKWGKLYVRLN